MIEFATFFLGLVVGAQNLELVAGPGVARIEIRLDERRVTELRSAPWRTLLELGPTLEPHELTAVAFDAKGRETSRVWQSINRPRGQAEAAIVLQGGADGRGRRVRVMWHAIAAPGPQKWSVTFDGKSLPVADVREFDLPPYVPEQVHFLRVELDFPENASAVAETFFGGHDRDETFTELTAVPVLLTGKKPPEPRTLEGVFRDREEPLRVVAVEEGPAEVVIVLDASAKEDLARLDAASILNGQNAIRLRTHQRLRIVWPTPELREHSGFTHQVFPMSEDLSPDLGGVLWLVNHVQRPTDLSGQRLAEAVAVSALSAAGRNRRRAVVLLLGREPRDGSEIPAHEIRRYLERLGVPLFVWSVVPAAVRPGSLDWSDARDVSTRHLFRRAVDALDENLQCQRIVWVDGRHLPQRVVLAGSPGFVAVAGSPATPGAEPIPETSSDERSAPVVAGAGEALVPAGSRLRQEPDPLALALATVDADIALPVLDRRDTWIQVRYESWKGWIQPGVEGNRAPLALDSGIHSAPDRSDELRRARSFLKAAGRPWSLASGYGIVYSDVSDIALLDQLANAIARFAPSYGERYGIPMGSPLPRVGERPQREKLIAVLYASEGEYRSFTGPEDDGLADSGLAVLFRGDRGADEVRRELVRAIARQANHARVSPDLPPWLDEGIAADLALREAPDGGASVRLVREAEATGRRPRLSALAGFPRRQFFAHDVRSLNVALSGLLVRYLIDAAGRPRAEVFRDVLFDASRGTPPRADLLLTKLGTDWEGLEKRFTAWLDELARPR